MIKKKIWERIIPLSQADRNFDIKFWQAQGARVRFRVAWNMVVDYYRMKGLDMNELRLDESKERLLRRRK